MSRPDSEGDGGGFLGRWAKRKQEVQKQDTLKRSLSVEPSDLPAPAPNVSPAQTEEELPLPSLDSIIPGSDVSAFFQKHVPEALRTAALRKLWVTDPEIKNFIEMADYQWDFNNPDAIPGWSSSVGDFDAKRLIERIMGDDTPKETILLDRSAQPAGEKTEPSSHMEPALEPALDAGSQPVSENTKFPLITEASGPFDETASAPQMENGALQKNTMESTAYEVGRKRHGGALPT